jgi:predicted NBD/HSP70 family sugar kinase
METFSLSDIKKKNLFDVYHFIYEHPECSKQAIANALQISLPTVTQHLTTLLDEQLIQKCGQLSSSVGRRAMAYQAIATARIAIGIEVLDRSVYMTALNLYGKQEVKEKFRITFRNSQDYFEELKDLVQDFLTRNGFSDGQILGIGLGMQGLASPDGSTMTYGEILGCTGLSIEGFAKYFSVPCRFIHDAECASISELWENPEIKDAIYLSLGYHLGGAIIIDGHLQNGLTGKSGTFEHMTLIPGGADCYCGRKGCAECYCSGASLLNEDMDLEEFFLKKEKGDASCVAKWNDYLHHLALLINTLHMVIESIVILGGHITPYFTEQDIETVRQLASDQSAFPVEEPYILQGRCRNDAVSTGAALPFIKDFLESMDLERTP